MVAFVKGDASEGGEVWRLENIKKRHQQVPSSIDQIELWTFQVGGDARGAERLEKFPIDEVLGAHDPHDSVAVIGE